MIIRSVFAILFLLTGCTKESADLILTNATVYTMDDSLRTAEAIAIRDGRILAVGSTQEIRERFVSRHIENCSTMTIIPGLNDAHLHLLGLGRALRQVDLVGTSSYAEVLSLIRAKISETPPDLWIQGRGWDQNDWPEKEFPTNTELNAVSPDHFVFVKRIDGHAALANHRALQAAGITRLTPDPPGGKIIRHTNGDPTGVLIDNAMELVSPFIPQPTLQEDSIALELAMQSCLRVGLTSVHDPGIDTTGLRAYRHAGLNGQLKVRVYAMLDGMDTALVSRQLASGPEVGLYDNFFSLASIKLYADGALGSRGAALLEPYDDDSGNRGLLLTPPSFIERVTAQALTSGFQVCTHAIGDRGNREVLAAYASALRQTGMDGKQKRLRIEHAQVVHPDDIRTFAELGIVASMQPTHCTSDMYWAEQRIGPVRVRGAYAWKSMRKAGVVVAGGSDAPVESNHPLWGIYAAVTRQDHKLFPESGWQPQEKLDRMESVSMFTRDAAYAEFAENFKGRIRKGMAADLTVLSKDIMTIEPLEILSTQILMTVVEGQIAFKP